jgi:hypothetical protein
MPRVPFDTLPGHGRLWVFPTSRVLTESEGAALLADVDDFLAPWAAHGAPLRSARELRESRFLMVGVDVDAEVPSGCSIDALVNRLRAFGERLDVTLIDHAPVWFRRDGAVESVSRAAFRAMVAAGTTTLGDAVFDTSLTRVEQLREGGLERPASETWHGRAFFRSRVEA